MSDEQAIAYIQYFVYYLMDEGKTDKQFLDALDVATSALKERVEKHRNTKGVNE